MSEEKLRQIIQKKREQVAARNLNAAKDPMLLEQVSPALHIPSSTKRSDTAFLLIHGLLDSASIMRSIYDYYQEKNKINLCFVDRLVQIDNDNKIKLNK